MSHNHATQKLSRYWSSLYNRGEGISDLFTVPKDSFPSGFLFARRGGQIPLPEGEPTRQRFVLFPYIKDKKQNSRGNFLKYRRGGQIPLPEGEPTRQRFDSSDRTNQQGGGNFTGGLLMTNLIKFMIVCVLILGVSIPVFAAKDGEKSSAKSGKQEAVEEDRGKSVEKPKEESKGKAVAKAESDSAAKAVETPKQEAPKEEMASKTISGEVAGISPSFIAVMYGQDEKTSYELALNLDKKVRIVGKNDISEIHVGDTVTVSFDERFQKDEKGDVRINGRKVTAIAFVREGKKLVEEESPVSATAEEASQERPQERSQK